MAALAFVVIAGALSAQNILFVGNSFTFVPGDIGVGKFTELNVGNKGGGVPQTFQVLASAQGKNPTVTMETVGGKTLQFHYEERRELIEHAWDIVILQDYSTGPLIDGADHKSYDSFLAHVTKLKALFVAKNPNVKIWVYETWARPDLVTKGRFTSIEEMQTGLRDAYRLAAKDNALEGCVPVGEAFLSAVKQGLADNPATDVVEGPLKIWGKDNYHQSGVGAYLSALMFYGAIYDADPTEIPSDNAAAIHLKISASESKILQSLAKEQLAKTPARSPLAPKPEAAH